MTDATPAIPDPAPINRREALSLGAAMLAAPLLLGAARAPGQSTAPARWFEVSLAQWSFHRALRAGEFDTAGFVRVARGDYGLGAVEYVNQFFKDKARDAQFLSDLRAVCDAERVRSLLIMIDGEGALGDPDEAARTRAIENHKPWAEAAAALGCHSIRVNAQSGGTFEEQQRLAADGLRRLCQFADTLKINVIVENHGGLSSRGDWLAGVIRAVDHPRCGTLPDFGNFRVSDTEEYDRYRGTQELMPFARGVSAKSYDFDEQGNETTIDFARMLAVVRDAGYRGHIGIEYEGGRLSERDGVRKTLELLVRLRDAQ